MRVKWNRRLDGGVVRQRPEELEQQEFDIGNNNTEDVACGKKTTTTISGYAAPVSVASSGGGFLSRFRLKKHGAHPSEDCHSVCSVSSTLTQNSSNGFSRRVSLPARLKRRQPCPETQRSDFEQHIADDSKSLCLLSTHNETEKDVDDGGGKESSNFFRRGGNSTSSRSIFSSLRSRSRGSRDFPQDEFCKKQSSSIWKSDTKLEKQKALVPPSDGSVCSVRSVESVYPCFSQSDNNQIAVTEDKSATLQGSKITKSASLSECQPTDASSTQTFSNFSHSIKSLSPLTDAPTEKTNLFSSAKSFFSRGKSISKRNGVIEASSANVRLTRSVSLSDGRSLKSKSESNSQSGLDSSTNSSCARIPEIRYGENDPAIPGAPKPSKKSTGRVNNFFSALKLSGRHTQSETIQSEPLKNGVLSKKPKRSKIPRPNIPISDLCETSGKNDGPPKDGEVDSRGFSSGDVSSFVLHDPPPHANAQHPLITDSGVRVAEVPSSPFVKEETKLMSTGKNGMELVVSQTRGISQKDISKCNENMGSFSKDLGSDVTQQPNAQVSSGVPTFSTNRNHFQDNHNPVRKEVKPGISEPCTQLDFSFPGRTKHRHQHLFHVFSNDVQKENSVFVFDTAIERSCSQNETRSGSSSNRECQNGPVSDKAYANNGFVVCNEDKRPSEPVSTINVFDCQNHCAPEKKLPCYECKLSSENAHEFLNQHPVKTIVKPDETFGASERTGYLSGLARCDISENSEIRLSDSLNHVSSAFEKGVRGNASCIFNEDETYQEVKSEVAAKNENVSSYKMGEVCLPRQKDEVTDEKTLWDEPTCACDLVNRPNISLHAPINDDSKSQSYDNYIVPKCDEDIPQSRRKNQAFHVSGELDSRHLRSDNEQKSLSASRERIYDLFYRWGMARGLDLSERVHQPSTLQRARSAGALEGGRKDPKTVFHDDTTVTSHVIPSRTAFRNVDFCMPRFRSIKAGEQPNYGITASIPDLTNWDVLSGRMTRATLSEFSDIVSKLQSLSSERAMPVTDADDARPGRHFNQRAKEKDSDISVSVVTRGEASLSSKIDDGYNGSALHSENGRVLRSDSGASSDGSRCEMISEVKREKCAPVETSCSSSDARPELTFALKERSQFNALNLTQLQKCIDCPKYLSAISLEKQKQCCVLRVGDNDFSSSVNGREALPQAFTSRDVFNLGEKDGFETFPCFDLQAPSGTNGVSNVLCSSTASKGGELSKNTASKSVVPDVSNCSDSSKDVSFEASGSNTVTDCEATEVVELSRGIEIIKDISIANENRCLSATEKLGACIENSGANLLSDNVELLSDHTVPKRNSTPPEASLETGSVSELCHRSWSQSVILEDASVVSSDNVPSSDVPSPHCTATSQPTNVQLQKFPNLGYRNRPSKTKNSFQGPNNATPRADNCTSGYKTVHSKIPFRRDSEQKPRKESYLKSCDAASKGSFPCLDFALPNVSGNNDSFENWWLSGKCVSLDNISCTTPLSRSPSQSSNTCFGSYRSKLPTFASDQTLAFRSGKPAFESNDTCVYDSVLCSDLATPSETKNASCARKAPGKCESEDSFFNSNLSFRCSASEPKHSVSVVSKGQDCARVSAARLQLPREVVGQVRCSLEGTNTNAVIRAGARPSGSRQHKSRIPRKQGNATRPLVAPRPVRPPMWLSKAELSQEIQHLSTLCESRTKELNRLRMETRKVTTGFDALAVVVRYMTVDLKAFENPSLIADLKEIQDKVNQGKEELGYYQEEIEKLNTIHANEMKVLSETMQSEHQEKVQEIISKHNIEVNHLNEQHEKEIKTLSSALQASCDEEKKQNAKMLNDLQQELRNQREEMEIFHQHELNDLEEQHLEKQNALMADIEKLQKQYEESKQLSQNMEDALQKDTDTRLQWLTSKRLDLQNEVDSLKAVLEIKNNELHSLRKENLEMQKELEELPLAREKIKMLQARAEDLQALMTEKVRIERQLSTEHQAMKETYEREAKVTKRLSMENEELVWRLKQITESSLMTIPMTDECETETDCLSDLSSSCPPAFSEEVPSSPVKSPRPASAASASRPVFFTYMNQDELNARSPQSPRTHYKRIQSGSAPLKAASPAKQYKSPSRPSPRKSRGSTDLSPHCGGETPRKIAKCMNRTSQEVSSRSQRTTRPEKEQSLGENTGVLDLNALVLPESMVSSGSSENSVFEPCLLEEHSEQICESLKMLEEQRTSDFIVDVSSLSCNSKGEWQMLSERMDCKVASVDQDISEAIDPKTYYHMTFPVRESVQEIEVYEGNKEVKSDREVSSQGDESSVPRV